MYKHPNGDKILSVSNQEYASIALLYNREVLLINAVDLPEVIKVLIQSYCDLGEPTPVIEAVKAGLKEKKNDKRYN